MIDVDMDRFLPYVSHGAGRSNNYNVLERFTSAV